MSKKGKLDSVRSWWRCGGRVAGVRSRSRSVSVTAMRETTKRDDRSRAHPLSSREEWAKWFEKHFGRAWDASSKALVLAAVRKRKEAFLALREIERVVVGFWALTRMLEALPPPEEEPPPVFRLDRKHDERYLLVWAFEEGLVPFASGPVSPRALAVVSLLMGYEHDAHQDGAIKRAESRMKTTRRRYRQERAPTTPETMQRIAQARALRVLEAPMRQALDALMQVFEGTVHRSESVP